MKKLLGGKKWTVAGMLFVLLLFIGIIVLGVLNYVSLDMTVSQTVFIDGEYSVDGGAWKPIDN